MIRAQSIAGALIALAIARTAFAQDDPRVTDAMKVTLPRAAAAVADIAPPKPAINLRTKRCDPLKFIGRAALVAACVRGEPRCTVRSGSNDAPEACLETRMR